MIGNCPRLIALSVLALCMAGCSSPSAAYTPSDPVAQAAVEATAILQQARATALVLQAQVQATQLIKQAGEAPATPTIPATLAAAPESLPTEPISRFLEIMEEESSPLDTQVPLATPPAGAEPATVELLSVGFAAEGGFIIVNFKAPPAITQTWWQGSVEVIDEASGMVYNEIPVMPVIGPLIGRPVEAGQNGYVMLTHNPPALRQGALVTVILGDYKFEHVKVE